MASTPCLIFPPLQYIVSFWTSSALSKGMWGCALPLLVLSLLLHKGRLLLWVVLRWIVLPILAVFVVSVLSVFALHSWKPTGRPVLLFVLPRPSLFFCIFKKFCWALFGCCLFESGPCQKLEKNVRTFSTWHGHADTSKTIGRPGQKNENWSVFKSLPQR